MSTELLSGIIFGVHLQEALGLGGRAIRKMVLTVAVDDVVTLEVEEYVEKENWKKVVDLLKNNGGSEQELKTTKYGLVELNKAELIDKWGRKEI